MFLVKQFLKSLELIFLLDNELFDILLLSFKVSFIALFVSCLIGFPIGAFLAISKFKFKNIFVAILNALMGLPPVVVGLVVYYIFI